MVNAPGAGNCCANKKLLMNTAKNENNFFIKREKKDRLDRERLLGKIEKKIGTSNPIKKNQRLSLTSQWLSLLQKEDPLFLLLP